LEKWRMRASAAFAEGFEKLSLSKLIFQIPLIPPFLKGEENAFAVFSFRRSSSICGLLEP